MNICNLLMKMPAFERLGEEAVMIPRMRAAALQKGIEAQNIQENSRLKLTDITDMWFRVKKEGNYGVVVKVMSPYNNRAQTVCKALLNGKELNTFQTNGTNSKWIYQKLLTVRLEKGWYHLNLEFPKPGMQVACMEFIMEE